MLFLLFQLFPIFLSILMKGTYSNLVSVKLYSHMLYQQIYLDLFSSKVLVQNPAALPSNPTKRISACWEPTVMATIIIPSE